jgi:uncharacterized damage-inducible protein DinB
MHCAPTQTFLAGVTVSIAETLLPEFDNEMKTTRRVLERVPSDKAEWKPHPKSFSIGHLAQLVSGMPGWITNAIQKTELDLSGGPKYTNEKTEALLSEFDKNVAEAHAAIAASKDADYKVNWSLKFGDRVVMTQPRAEVVRTHLNHLIHHRAQLTVYLRLLDVPVPSVYGPTADEKMPGF